MIIERNDCCDCAVPSYPCMGNSCPLRHVRIHVCDECESEALLYDYEGRELCQDCLLDIIPTIAGTENLY